MSKIASAIIVRDGAFAVLMGRRLPSNRWGLPGGKVEDGETFEDAMKRELQEEVGIRSTNHKHLTTLETTDKWTVSVFECTEWEGDIRNLEPTKCSGWKFLKTSDWEPQEAVYSLQMLRSKGKL
jgi:mutator protein MutT